MEAHLHEWLHLLIRWMHFIFGVAWIGASFYFNWLENNLNRELPQEQGIVGNLWAIHGGGFYHLKKFRNAPQQLPAVLHWFKWEAYTTWLSGFALLVVVYYFNAQGFLINPQVSAVSTSQAITLGIVAVIGSWLVYDGLCRSPLQRLPLLLGTCIFFALVALAWGLSAVFSARAAYIHVGAAIGTMMVGNVFFVIIPAQKEMVAALLEKRRVEVKHSRNGLLRSRHNNYLTLPVLFIMISSHFPSTYAHPLNWLLLAGVSAAGWLARHYFNIRQHQRSAIVLLPVAFLLMLGLAWWSAPQQSSPTTLPALSTSRAPTTAEVMSIIHARCSGCHAHTPTQPGFATPPAGVVLETIADIERQSARIINAAVVTRAMPIGNLSGMTEQERALLGDWHNNLDKAKQDIP